MHFSFLPTFTALIAVCGSVAAFPSLETRDGRCSQKIAALAAGIELNIIAQHGELNQTEALITLESASTLNQTAIYEGIGGLINDIKAGIFIRTFNQAISPPNNPSKAGLAKYEAAQATELGLAESLTGVPSHDLSILDTIKSDVMAGIMLNQMNEVNATQNCKFNVDFPTAY